MKSSPEDLAVAFLSLSRRLREAPDADTPRDVIDLAEGAVHGAVTAAATVLGSVATAEGVAAAIRERHARDWSDADLDALQTHASDAARAIRDLENASSS